MSSEQNRVCFVVAPIGDPESETRRRSDQILKHVIVPVCESVGYKPVRADQISEPGIITTQVIQHIIDDAMVIADLSGRNPNVFYELGIAHALKKPVVLVSSNEEDVPFDVRHIRVIYYDVNDPFWGEKLVNKVAENIVSALTNPEEAIFRSGVAG